VVADPTSGDTWANGIDDAGSFMATDHWKVNIDVSRSEVLVRVAQT
jgi:hypothetical protein